MLELFSLAQNRYFFSVWRSRSLFLVRSPNKENKQLPRLGEQMGEKLTLEAAKKEVCSLFGEGEEKKMKAFLQPKDKNLITLQNGDIDE